MSAITAHGVSSARARHEMPLGAGNPSSTVSASLSRDRRHGPEGAEPESVWQVMHRQKEIQYSSRAITHIATLPMFHCNGRCFTWSISVKAGVHVCLRQVCAKAIYDLIAEHKVTHLCGAPIVMSVLLTAAERAWRSDRASRRPRIPGPVGRDRPGVSHSMPDPHYVERSRESRGIVDGCRKSQWERFRRAQTSRPPGVRRPGHFSGPTNVDPDQCAHAAICGGANGRLDGTSKTSRTWSFQLR